MSSSFYNAPYEKGKEDQKQRLIRVVLKLSTKKFDISPKELRKKIKTADSYNLEMLAEDIFDFKLLEDVNKYL